MSVAVQALIALGSNQQDPLLQLQRAVVEINKIPKTTLLQTSPFYLTSPVSPIAQDDFVNAVVAVSTYLSAFELLLQLQQIEIQQGRIREHRFGPRVLDLDILLFGDEIHTTEVLQIPHPRMSERLFVLEPLATVRPDLQIGGMRILDKIQYLKSLGDQRICEI